MKKSAFRSIPAALLVLTTVLFLATSAGAQSVGIYNDAAGSSCTLMANSPGTVSAYVVVRPSAAGVTGLQFAAPKPACFNGTYVGDVSVPNTLVLGNSQSGVSIALQGCFSEPRHVLTIQYFTDGTTGSCCPYPVIPDPLVTNVLLVDCAFNEIPATGMVSYVNPDASCSCTGNSPPSYPDLPNPANNAINVGVNTPLSWTATDIDNNLAEFDVYLGTTATPPLVATVTEQSYSPSLPLDEFTQYYWYVVARDGGGLETTGPQWTFTTRAANSSPSAPFGPVPFSGAVAMPVDLTLGWQASDIDGDSLVFDVYLGNVSTPPLIASNVPANSFTPPTFAFDTTYWWRIVARDPLGLETSGPVWHFRTKLSNYPPGAPNSPAPANNAFNVSTNVTLSWQSSDADGDSLWYEVFFGTAANPPLFDTVGTPSLHLPALMQGTHYNWRVVAHDGTTETSGPVWAFTTVGANIPPDVPSSPSPINGATGVAWRPFLSWQCSDPNGDALVYDLRLGITSPPALVEANLPIKQFQIPSNLWENQLYYWQIVARDQLGGVTEGPIWSFTTSPNLPPIAPYGPNPTNGGVSTLTPRLSWTGGDPNGQTVFYDVYFGTQTSPPLVSSHQPAASYMPGTLVAGTTYYWRIVASDGTFQTSGPLWSFEARSVPAGLSRLELWGDVNGTRCSLSDVGVQSLPTYVILKPDPAGGATGLQFSAPKPACFTGIWVGDVVPNPYLSIGDSQNGISIALTSCVTTPVPVLTIQYLGLGTSPPCCSYPILPDPTQSNIIVVDCNFAELASQGGAPLIFNEGPECPCGALVPVLISRFEATPKENGIEVRWELSGDETATQYTLLRRDGDAGAKTAVAQGSVTATSGSYVDSKVEPGTTYHYELVVRTADGNEFQSPEITVTSKAVAFALGQNHPNPFNPTTVIPYSLSNGVPARVKLIILDVSGAVVRTLVDTYQAGGTHEATWDGRDDRGGPVSSGIYFSVLDADGKRQTRKMVLLK